MVAKDERWLEDISGLKTLLDKMSRRFSKRASKYIDLCGNDIVKDSNLVQLKFKNPLNDRSFGLPLFPFNERLNTLHSKLCTSGAIYDIIKKDIKKDRNLCESDHLGFFNLKLSYQFIANVEYMFYCLKSYLDIVGHVLNEIYQLGILPNSVSFTCAITKLEKKGANNAIVKYFRQMKIEYEQYNQLRNYICHHGLLPITVTVSEDLTIIPHYLKTHQDLSKYEAKGPKANIEEITLSYLNYCIDMYKLLMVEITNNLIEPKYH